MEIVQHPNNLCFAGNLPDIRLTNVTDSVPVRLLEAGTTEAIIDEIFFPDSKGSINIDLKAIVQSRLSINLPPQGLLLFNQPSVAKTFTLSLGDTEISFTALYGGISNYQGTVTDFLTHNFLSWRIFEQKIKQDSMIFLSYYPQEECRLKIEATLENGSRREYIQNLQFDQYYTINLSPAFLSGLLYQQAVSYKVWIEAASSYPLTPTVSYSVTETRQTAEEYLFINSLGGIDTLIFTGEYTRNHSTSSVLAKINSRYQESSPDLNVVYKQNTGYLDAETALFVQDFFLSPSRYHLVAGSLHRILIEEQENKYTPFSLNFYEFEYRHEEEPRLINLIPAHEKFMNYLPPYWDQVIAYFDKKRGNTIIDRKRGLQITLEGNQIHFPAIPETDVFNKTNKNYWLSDIPQVTGKPRTWTLSQLTGVFTINYTTDHTSHILFFRDIDDGTIGDVLPIIVYEFLLDSEIAEVMKFLKQCYFLEDRADGKLLVENSAFITTDSE